MLSVDVGDIELYVMEDQIHMTITGTVCAVIFGVVYWSLSSREALIAEEVGSYQGDMDLETNIYKKEDWTTPRTGVVCLVVAYIFYLLRLINHLYFDQIEAILRKVTGLKSVEENSPRQPIQLGPHSYNTLILSILCCIVILAIIWLIKITPFERLYKCSPLYKLVKILYNSPDLELEEDDRMTRASPEQTARHQQILNTCVELERRMSRLEQCLTPLAKSLQTLSDVIESRGEAQSMDHQESRVMDHQETHVMDHQDSQVKDHQESQVMDRQETQVKDHQESQVKDHREFQVYDHQESQVNDHQESQVKDHHQECQVMDILEAQVHTDFKVTDFLDLSLPKSMSDSQVTNRLNAKVDRSDFQDAEPVDSQFTDPTAANVKLFEI